MNIRALYYLIAVIGLCVGSFMLRDGMPLMPPSIGHIASVLILGSSAIALIGLFRQDALSRHLLQREYELYEAENAVRQQIVEMRSPQNLNDVLREIRRVLQQLGVEHDSASIQIVNEAGTDFVSLYTDKQHVTFERLIDRSWTRDSNNAVDYPWVIETWRSGQPLYQPDTKLALLPDNISRIDMPFASGTLAINSSSINAFGKEDIVPLERIARLLDEGCRRLVEIASHQTLLEQARNISDQTHCLAWEAHVYKVEEDNFEWQTRIVNEEAAQRFLPLDLAPGQSYAEAWFQSRPVEDRIQGDNVSRIALNTGQTLYSFRFRSLDRDGKMHYLLENTHIEHIDDTHWKVFGVANDITEIQETEQCFQAALQNAVDGFAIIDERGFCEVFNPAAERIFGYSAPEIVGQNIRLLMTEPHRGKPNEYIAKFLARGWRKGLIGQGTIVQGQRKDGMTFPMELSVGEFTANGRRLYTCVVRDESNRMRDEHEQTVLHRMREQVWAMENTGDITQVLHALYKGLVAINISFDNCGINIVDLKSDPLVFMPYAIDNLGQQLEQLKSGEVAIEAEEFTKAWRERRPFYRRDLAVEDRNEEMEKLLGTFGGKIRSVIDLPFAHGTFAVNSHLPNAYSKRDIVSLQELATVLEEAFNRNSDITTREQYYADLETEISVRQQTEDNLKEALSAAEAANQAKGQFVANMSHEIRTPMNAVIGMTELTLETALDDSQREFLDIVKASADSLLQLINDILDFSKIEVGQLDLENIAFDLRPTVKSSVKTLAMHARKKNIELNYRIDEDVADALLGDPSRLRQALIILLSNAVKFTEQGTITVSVRCLELDPGQTTLLFEVRDTGIGIPANKLEDIFEPFTQIDASTTRRYGGTGIGLSICVQIAEIMGGRIEVESEEGAGSTFTFTVRFPLQTRPEPKDQTVVESESLSPRPNLHILIVEDNVFNQKVAIGLLKQRGHSVTVANDGQEALDLTRDSLFDAVLMDLQMPGKDGLETTRELRLREQGSGQRLHIIGLTAHAMGGHHQRCLDAGMDDYLTKPIRVQLLDQALAAVRVPTAPAPPGPLASAPEGD